MRDITDDDDDDTQLTLLSTNVLITTTGYPGYLHLPGYFLQSYLHFKTRSLLITYLCDCDCDYDCVT